MYMTQPDRQRIQHIRDYCEEIRKTIDCYSSPEAVLRGTACRKLIIKRYTNKADRDYSACFSFTKKEE